MNNAVFADALQNGLRIVTVEMPQLHSAEIVAYVALGGRDEAADDTGVAHFLEHMIFRGTAAFANSLALERAFEEIGGTINAATDMESTSFFSRIHPHHIDRGFELLGEMLGRPQLRGLETERRIIQEEALEDLNEQGQEINPDNLSARLLWPNHPLGRPLIGTAETMAQIDEATLRQYYQRYYVPQNIVLAAAGCVERDRVLAAAQRWFSVWPPTPPATSFKPMPPQPMGPQSLWVEDSSSQLSVQLAFRAPGRNHKDAPGLRVLRRILAWGGNSRLMRRLREELGLIYAVDADLMLYADCGSLAIDMAITPENLQRALSEIWTLLARLRRNVVAADELAAVLRGYRYDLEFSQDLPEEMVARYGWGLLAGCCRSVEDDMATLEKVTAGYVQEVAQRWLVPTGAALVVVGPYRAADRCAVQNQLQALAQEEPL